MNNSISLEWKQFQVDLLKVNNYFKSTLSSNYDGLVGRNDYLLVIFKDSISESDLNLVNDYWNSINSNSFLETDSEKWTKIREQRNLLIQQTEWIKSRHRDQVDNGIQTTLTAEQYQSWLNYWQALRDLPGTFSNPDNVVFPQEPNI